MTEQPCTFEKCRFNMELQCTVPEEYEKCNRGNIFTVTEKIYEKYPNDKDIWILLQEVVRIGQDVKKSVELSKEVSELHGKVEKILREMENQKAGGKQDG